MMWTSKKVKKSSPKILYFISQNDKFVPTGLDFSNTDLAFDT